MSCNANLFNFCVTKDNFSITETNRRIIGLGNRELKLPKNITVAFTVFIKDRLEAFLFKKFIDKHSCFIVKLPIFDKFKYVLVENITNNIIENDFFGQTSTVDLKVKIIEQNFYVLQHKNKTVAHNSNIVIKKKNSCYITHCGNYIVNKNNYVERIKK